MYGHRYGEVDPPVGTTFSHEPRPEEVCHLSILKALTSRMSITALERVERSSVRFQRNVFTILKMIRPISHTSPDKLPETETPSEPEEEPTGDDAKSSGEGEGVGESGAEKTTEGTGETEAK